LQVALFGSATNAFVRFKKAITQKVEEAAEACEDCLRRVGPGFPLLKKLAGRSEGGAEEKMKNNHGQAGKY